MTRIITAAIGISLLVYVVKFTPDYISVALIFIAMLMAVHEYFLLTRNGSSPAFHMFGYVLASAIVAAFYFSTPSAVLAMLFIAPAILLMIVLFTHRDLAEALSAASFTLFGASYVGGSLGFLVSVRKIESIGADLLLMLLVIVWSNDIFAFLAGKSIGRHKLASIVSPKKTVEGAVAGFVAGIIASILYAHFLVPSLGIFHASMIGALIGITGQIGDLCESILKRVAQVKDSGTIVPGHGGMLDRIDSLLFGAPTMYYYFYFFLQK